MAVDAAKTRNSVLDKSRTEQNYAAREKAEWKPSGSETDMIGSDLHTVDSDLLHQGHNITWLEKVTAQVLWSGILIFSQRTHSNNFRLTSGSTNTSYVQVHQFT